ncbi:hypothetical protein PFISCL1PPCAC_11277 [Pristionchus fissidentatus]|uniref:Enhancer of polycomb-like protein n=1 Tax=Pristionchus fissidentatus TaxID=1538716 RepID=A0AAV5VPT4_9BILA|nr:hypothetical protein PFISCL1PPCAC_11277 [Pristionchus fissidentatus]
MTTTSKLSFRSRNLDANRGMKVFYADELPDISECAPIARGVNPMPTGMEKEEEMEVHLQDAILAQQASTSGISDNHVIPTPKVLYIDDARFDQVYPVQPPCKAQLMKVQAWLSMEREEAEYDMDSEDEEYLRDKPHINARDLERIIESLEGQSSESAICQPATARKVLMPHFDDNVIDDVYDYWLAKRKDAATQKILGFGGLIPRIRTECRKENEKLNPYVAFRRRAEKMQTRKNRKNDEDSYEKVLRLGHDLRRAVHLFEMMKRREKSKLAMLDLDAEILTARAQLGDYGSVVYNQIVAKLQPEEEQRVPTNGVAPTGATSDETTPAQPLREENGVRRKKIRKRVTGLRTVLGAAFDRELPNKAWLKKNAEVWNQSPTAFISGMSNCSPAVEVDQSIAAANTANADGRYAFKRRRGCHYRSAIPLKDKNRSVPSLESIPPERRFYYVSLPSTSKDTRVPSSDAPTTSASIESVLPIETSSPTVLLRRRIGRGGRVIFDRFPQPPPTAAASTTSQRSSYVAGRTNSLIYDPFELDCAAMGSAETTTWSARQRPHIEAEEDDDLIESPPVSSRYLYSSRYRSTWSREDEEADADAETRWLASAVSPSPSPEPPSTAPPSAKRHAPPRQEDATGAEPSPPSEHEEATPISMKSHLMDVMGLASTANGNTNGGGETRGRQAHHEDVTMDEEDGTSSDSPIEDSPTSSSDHDHPENTPIHLLPLGAGAAPVHHLHLASGNASVLSPPDSTAPSPRVSNGSGSTLAPVPASPAPHTNGIGSGNGMVGGYEAAMDVAPASDEAADPWKVHSKLMAMEAVASRLATRVKHPDASSRESGCSPTEKSLPSIEGDDGMVVQLVEPWREPSNSPSESNSSSDWTPPTSSIRTNGDVNGRISAYATLSSEEESGARTGDHPTLPAKPSRKQNGSSTVQMAGMPRSFALAASAPSPVV